MEILTVYQTENRCYQQARKATQVGVVVHATGAVNRELRRYVDAAERLGKNQYDNHWNKASADKCMHAFIGYDKDKKIIVAETLPYEYACWGCGKGKKGSYNYDPTAHIQFEICQGSDTDDAYYQAAIAVAAEYCAYLCRKFGFAVSDVCSHREASLAGYASNHGAPENWMQCFGDDMDRFRARIAALLSDGTPAGNGSSAAGETNTDSALGSRLLKSGSKGADVKALQEALLRLGYSLPRYGADGKYGAETEAAVKAFQQKAGGLSVDGKYGDKTHAALMDALADAEKNDNQLETPTQPDVQDDAQKEEPITPEPGKVVIVSSSGKVNIRKGNGTQYACITQAAPGNTFDFVATAANGWNAIVVNDQVGWVSGNYSKIA